VVDLTELLKRSLAGTGQVARDQGLPLRNLQLKKRSPCAQNRIRRMRRGKTCADRLSNSPILNFRLSDMAKPDERNNS